MSMSTYQCINFNNKIYFISKNHNENNNHFIERIWYIINQINLKKNKDKSFNDIVNMSNIYINEIKNNCIYHL
jgi:hypothetical protein